MRISLHVTIAVIYLAICVFDFLLAPVYFMHYNSHLTPQDMITLAAGVKDGTQVVPVLTILHNQSEWTPITLGGGGLFHVAMGGLLGVSTWRKYAPDVACDPPPDVAGK